MENLSSVEIRQIIREELRDFFKKEGRCELRNRALSYDNDTEIEELDLSVRLYNALKYGAKIKTLGEMRLISEKEFHKIKFVGKKSWIEMQEVIEESK